GCEPVTAAPVWHRAVARWFSAYTDSLLGAFGRRLPSAIREPVFYDSLQRTGSWFNLPGFLIVMILTVILVRGIRERASTNNFMVSVKLVAIVIFIVAASRHIQVSNWKPFMPNGWQGVL